MFGRMKTPPELDKITQFFEQPEIRAIADRVAAEALKRRKALVAQLGECCQDRVDAKCAAAVKSLAEAEAKATAAKVAFESACVKREEARHVLGSISLPLGYQRQALEAELVATADPRLGSFIATLEDLWDQARHCVMTGVEIMDTGPTPAERKDSIAKRIKDATSGEIARFRVNGWVDGVAAPEVKKLATNYHRVADVLTKLRGVSTEVRAAQLEALDRDEVAGRLEAWRDALRQPLGSVGLLFALDSSREAA